MNFANRYAKPKLPRFTPDEAMVLSQIGDGADVWGYGEALVVRRIEREYPGVVRIVRAKVKPPGHMQQPYFGAKLTKLGKRALQSGE